MKDSKRPVILLGGGVKISKSENLVDKLINKTNIPIVTSWSGVDLIDHLNKKYIVFPL